MHMSIIEKAIYRPSKIEVIELDCTIDYTKPTEAMVADFLPSKEFSNSFLPTCKSSNTGVEQKECFLVRPVPGIRRFSISEIQTILADAGFEPEDLPALLNVKKHVITLVQANVRHVIAFGLDSQWQSLDGKIFVPCLEIDPSTQRTRSLMVRHCYYHGTWFLAKHM